jgi:adenosylhomocysteinase
MPPWRSPICGVPVFAWKGEDRCRTTGTISSSKSDPSPTGKGPNLLLDDGGDLTLLIHKGVEFEKSGETPDPDSVTHVEEKALLTTLKRSLEEDPTRFTDGERHQGRERRDDDRRASLYEMHARRASCSSRPST